MVLGYTLSRLYAYRTKHQLLFFAWPIRDIRGVLGYLGNLDKKIVGKKTACFRHFSLHLALKISSLKVRCCIWNGFLDFFSAELYCSRSFGSSVLTSRRYVCFGPRSQNSTLRSRHETRTSNAEERPCDGSVAQPAALDWSYTTLPDDRMIGLQLYISTIYWRVRNGCDIGLGIILFRININTWMDEWIGCLTLAVGKIFFAVESKWNVPFLMVDLHSRIKKTLHRRIRIPYCSDGRFWRSFPKHLFYLDSGICCTQIKYY